MTELSHQQRRALRHLLNRQPKAEQSHSAENFVLRYIFFEACIQNLTRYYRERNNRTPSGEASIDIHVVKRALIYFDVAVNELAVNGLLDSKLSQRNNKSARSLRNGIVHRWDKGDCEEAQQRFAQLTGWLNHVIDGIKTVSENG